MAATSMCRGSFCGTAAGMFMFAASGGNGYHSLHDQSHAALGTIARLVAHHIGVHRANIPRCRVSDLARLLNAFRRGEIKRDGGARKGEQQQNSDGVQMASNEVHGLPSGLAVPGLNEL